MLDGRHNLRRETLRVSVSSEALALAVRPRLESLNHAVLLPLVETVLDEFAEPDVHVRLDRLDLDLGTIDAADLDRLVPLRLADALRRQLATALQREGARTGAPRPSIRTATEARLDAVEYFLASGTLPFWVSPGTFDLDEVFGRLLDTAAGDLAALVRRLGLQSAALGRLILHLGDATLRRLLKALSPDEAAVILVYLTEIRDYHAIEPLIPVSDRKLARILWRVAFEYVVRDPGTQFNRRSLVERLLAGVAASERLRYRDVLSVFDVGVRGTEARRPIGATLLAVVVDLVEEERRVNPWFADLRRPLSGSGLGTEGVRVAYDERYAVTAALRYYVRHGVLPWQARLDDTPLTLRDAVTDLPRLSWSMLASLTADVLPSERAGAWMHLLREADEETIAALVTALASQSADEPDAARDRDRPGGDWQQADEGWRIARLAERMAERFGSPEDEPAAWTRVFDRPLPLAAPLWDVPLLTSVLTHRAVEASPREAGEPSSSELLARLIETAPDDARAWVTAMRATGVPVAPLLDEPLPSAETVTRTLLPPAAAMTVLVLHEALASLRPSERPGSGESLHLRILQEALAAPGTESPFALSMRVLRRLFGGRLPEGILDTLRLAAERLAERGAVTKAFAASLAAALASSAVPDETASATAGGAVADAGSVAHDPLALVTEWLNRFGHAPRPTDLPALDDAMLRQMLRRLMTQSPRAIVAVLRPSLSDPRARQRWVSILSEPELAATVSLLAPGASRPLLDAAERLFSGLGQTSPFRGSDLANRRALWLFLLEFLAGTAPSERTLERLTRAFFEYVGPASLRSLAARGDGGPSTSALEPVRQAIQRVARRSGDAALSAALAQAVREPATKPPAASPRPPAPPGDTGRDAARVADRPSGWRGRTAFSMNRDEELPGEGAPLYITNAGLVLTAPFLPRLFQSLHLLEPAGAAPRLAAEHLSRAVHLLQWITDGRTDAPEALLCLNKLLCGVPPATPVEPAVDLSPQDHEMGATLLRSMIANWTMISNTSIAGLQETFLQREGRLERVSNGWRLTVPRKTVDVLLDHLPWSLSTVVHSLMPEPIFVKW